MRFQYRIKIDDNTIQTLCVVSFDETGSCAGLQPLTLDLEQFLGSDQGPAGNSNLLEAGHGLFYATCLSSTGNYRLQQPGRRLPALYFTMVDALGDGQYSLGDTELTRQRRGLVTTFSGAELRPPWIVSISREIEWLHLTDGPGVEFNDEDCNIVPSCTYSPELVQPGDMLRIGVGLDGALMEAVYTGATPEKLDQFFRDRIGIKLEEFAGVHPDAARRAFERLVGLDVMDQLVHYFGELYKVRDKGVVVGYGPTYYPLPYPYACFPDQVASGETERCQGIEQAIQAEEARRIGTWQDEGYNLWFASNIDYQGEGETAPFSDLRPHFSLFNGVIAGIEAYSDVEVSDVGETFSQVVRHFAQDVGPGTPVVLTLNGPPITAQTAGGVCEADICPSDFKGMYHQAEAVLDGALQYLSIEQLKGFGVSLFEGAHFDIRKPYERYRPFALNRVAETGYNNPVLNIYRAGLTFTQSPYPPSGLSLPFRTEDVALRRTR